jgi:hypothetical protein
LHPRNSAPKEPTATKIADVREYVLIFAIEKIVVISFPEIKTILI